MGPSVAKFMSKELNMFAGLEEEKINFCRSLSAGRVDVRSEMHMLGRTELDSFSRTGKSPWC